MNVALPAYDRSKLSPGIVHIGLGNFHRAHMAVYLDDLFAMGLSLDWAILGAGVREGESGLASGAVETARELGGSLGLALLVSIALGAAVDGTDAFHRSVIGAAAARGLGPAWKRLEVEREDLADA